MAGQIFPASNVRRNPEDIELIEEVTLQQISDRLLRTFNLEGNLPKGVEPLAKHIRDLDLLKAGLAPIFDEMQGGDTLRWCRSRSFGPLNGHQGVALVRAERPIVYILMWHH